MEEGDPSEHRNQWGKLEWNERQVPQTFTKGKEEKSPP